MKDYQNYTVSDLNLFRATVIPHRHSNKQDECFQLQKLSTNQNQRPAMMSKSIERKHSKSKLSLLSVKANIGQISKPNKLTSIDQSQQKNTNKQHQQKSFMNIISKNHLSKDVLKFVYGQNNNKNNHYDEQSQTQTPSFQLKSQARTQTHCEVRTQRIESSPVGKLNLLMEGTSTFESFPTSKVKRSRDNSSRKNTQSGIQLSENCKKQIQCSTLTQLNSKTILQRNDTLQYNNQNGKQIIEGTKQMNGKYQQSEIQTYTSFINLPLQQLSIQKQQWQDTIKFNGKKLNEDKTKLMINNTESTAAHNSSRGKTISLNSEENMQDRAKNETRKISEFILCDEEIHQQVNSQDLKNKWQSVQQRFADSCQSVQKKENTARMDNQGQTTLQQSNENVSSRMNLKAFVPVFEIKLSDLKQQTFEHDHQFKQQSHQLHANINNIPKNSLQNVKFDSFGKIGENIEVLGKNIGDLSNTITNFCSINIDTKPVVRKETKLSLTKSFNEQFRQFKQYNQAQETFHPKNDQQTKYLTGYLNKKSFQLYQQRRQQTNGLHANEVEYNQFLPHQHQKQQQNQQMNLSQSVDVKVFDNQEMLGNNIKSPRNKPFNFLLGSLEVIDTIHQDESMSNSLQRFYQNEHSSLQLSPEKCNQILIQDRNNEQINYPDSLFPETKHVCFLDQESLKQIILEEQVYKLQDQSSVGPLQTVRPLRELNSMMKTYQKNRSKSEFNNKVAQQPPNNYQHQRRSSISKESNLVHKNTQRNEPLKTLNYEMHKIFENRTFTKQYTRLGIDQNKQKIIELPLMNNAVNLKLSGQGVYYPKYIKTKVYLVKG